LFYKAKKCQTCQVFKNLAGLRDQKMNQDKIGRLPNIKNKYLVPLSISGAVVLWQVIVSLGNFPAFILPSPGLVAERLLEVLKDGSLLRHTGVTLGEVLAGLTLGLGTAVVLGYLLAKSRRLEQILSPYIVASQSVPVVAIAPLLVIWLGPGILSKVLITALIVFFPILVNIIVGVRSVSSDLYDLMRSFQASRWQILRFLEIPAAMPVFLGGLRIGATLAVIGAVVGEFVGADRGLGFLINVGRGMYDTALVFVAIFTLVAMALVIYGLVSLIEKRFLAWQLQAEL
jgi:NitT/TauT family transport system permease protein